MHNQAAVTPVSFTGACLIKSAKYFGVALLFADLFYCDRSVTATIIFQNWFNHPSDSDEATEHAVQAAVTPISFTGCKEQSSQTDNLNEHLLI